MTFDLASSLMLGLDLEVVDVSFFTTALSANEMVVEAVGTAVAEMRTFCI
jgi:hypothetical protein